MSQRVFHALQLLGPGVSFELSPALFCANMKNAAVNNVNCTSDKTALLKMRLLGFPLLLQPAFQFIIKESCINGGQQFSVLQSHYIYREGMESNKKN